MPKKPLTLLFSGLLKLSLLGLALAGAGWLTFGTPDNLKDAAHESGIYSGIVDEFIESAKKGAGTSSEQNLPLNDPAITQIAKDSFSPDVLKTQSESIISGIYDWLQGDNSSPQFTIDLTEPKQKFVEGISSYAVTKYEALPVCTLQQLQTIDPNNIDPFNAPCRAPQISSATVKERVSTEITNNEVFLQETNFTASDLPKDEQGKTVFDYAESAPDAYRLFGIMPWIFGFSSLLLGLLVYTLSDNKKRAIKSIAITFLGVGIFLAVGSLLIGWSFTQMNSFTETASAFQNSLVDVARALVSTYNSELMKFYLTYIFIGSGVLFTMWYQKRRNTSLEQTK